MKTNYEIKLDPGKRLIRIIVSGFFKREEVVPFMLALRDGILAIECPPGQHLMLMDMGAVSLHSGDVVDAFSRQVGGARLIPRRLAVVVSGSLARMQVRRMFPGLEMTFFDDAATAEHWLLES